MGAEGARTGFRSVQHLANVQPESAVAGVKLCFVFLLAMQNTKKGYCPLSSFPGKHMEH